MKSIGIIYGSTTGNTQSAAEEIAKKLGVASQDVTDAGSATQQTLQSYDILLLGSSTWGVGELQDDWAELIDTLSGADLSGKMVGVFGTGDSLSYADSFCDAVGIIAQAAEQAGAQIIGRFPTADYDYSESAAEKDGSFYGLLLDYDNEDSKSAERIDQWTEQIKTEAGL